MEKIDITKLKGAPTLEVVIEQGKLLDKVFRVKDTGIDSKIFHTWKMAGILDSIESGKWANMSFIEYLWLCTLESMRKFGCSHNLMKKVHYELFKKAEEDELGKKTLKENITFLKKLSKERPLFADEIHYLTESERLLNDEKLINTLRKEITYFYQLVLKCFNNNNEVGIIIYEDQSFTTYELSGIVSKSDKVLDLSVPHIKIPITSFIKNFIEDEHKSNFLQSVGLITDQEMQVIKELRKQNIRSVTIDLDNNQNIIKIESTKTGFIHGEKARLIMNILGFNNYTGIELHTRDMKSLSFSRTKKKYI